MYAHLFILSVCLWSNLVSCYSVVYPIPPLIPPTTIFPTVSWVSTVTTTPLRTCTYIQYSCTHCLSMHSVIMQRTPTSCYFRSLHAAHTRPHPFTLIFKQGEWIGWVHPSRWTTLGLSYQLLNSECKCTQMVGYIAIVYAYLVFVHGINSFTFLSDLGTFAFPFHHRLSVSPHEVLTFPRMRVCNQLILQGVVYGHLIRKTFNDAFLIIATRLHSGECTSTTEGPIAKTKLSSCSAKSKLVIGAKISFDKMWRMGGLSREGHIFDLWAKQSEVGVLHHFHVIKLQRWTQSWLQVDLIFYTYGCSIQHKGILLVFQLHNTEDSNLHVEWMVAWW